MKFRIAFIIVHILLILGAVVFFTYWEYPEARGAGAGRFRRITLSEIHKEMKSYKKETGNYPEMLESILHYDEEKEQMFIRSKPLYVFRSVGDITNRLRYQILRDELVITDLGEDEKEGGLNRNMDIVFPKKYQHPFTFGEFVKTGHFVVSCLIGIILGLGVSVCLDKMWKKHLRVSTVSFITTLIFSIIFVAVELILALFILHFHLYPSGH